MFELTFGYIALALLITALAATVQASAGFGFAMLAVPLLALIDVDFVPGATLLASLLLAIVMSSQGRKNVDKASLPSILVGLFVGTILGALLLNVINSEFLPRLFGLFILLAVVLSIVGINITKNRSNLIATGFISGIMGTMSGIHGPPFALLYQNDKGIVVRPTLALLFLIGYSISLLSLLLSGFLNLKVLYLAALISPAVLLGFVLSRWVTRWLDRAFLRPSILLLASLSALSLIIRG